jgi:hypothetical protein
MTSQDLPKANFTRNTKLIGHSDQGGWPGWRAADGQQTCDVLVSTDGLVYSTDFNGGLFILEYKG